jgi:hypothetical protein
MRLTHDRNPYPYTGFYCTAFCRIRVFEDDPIDLSAVANPDALSREPTPPVVIATELVSNTGTSITNVAEFLALDVMTHLLPAYQWRPIIWIEHYERENERVLRQLGPGLSFVRFAHYHPVYRTLSARSVPAFGPPKWFHATPQEIERLTGQRLDLLSAGAEVAG